LKLVPLLLAANKVYLKLFPSCSYVYVWPFFLIGWAVMNAFLPPLGLIAAVLYGVACGVASAVVALQTDSIISGLHEPGRMIRALDETTNGWLADSFGCAKAIRGTSCFPAFRVRESANGRSDIHSASAQTADTSSAQPGLLTMEFLVASFSRTLQLVLSQSLSKCWLSRESVSDLDPSVMVGLPALATFSVLRSSALSLPKARTEFCLSARESEEAADGAASFIVDEGNLPQNAMTSLLWPKFVKCKALIEEAAFSADEIDYINMKLVAGGGTIENETVRTLVSHFEREADKAPQRRKQIGRIVSAVNSIAFDLSRLAIVMSACQNVFSQETSETDSTKEDTVADLIVESVLEIREQPTKAEADVGEEEAPVSTGSDSEPVSVEELLPTSTSVESAA
jgi:hypothetical protein